MVWLCLRILRGMAVVMGFLEEKTFAGFWENGEVRWRLSLGVVGRNDMMDDWRGVDGFPRTGTLRRYGMFDWLVVFRSVVELYTLLTANVYLTIRKQQPSITTAPFNLQSRPSAPSP